MLRASQSKNEASIERRRSAVVQCWTLIALALAAFAAWSAGPYIATELLRLEPWKILAICCGDLMALLWFMWFALSHLVFGEPLKDQPLSHASRWALGAFLVSVLGGLAFDFATTLYLHWDEQVRYQSVAVQATATVRSMKTSHATKGHNWTLDCEWRDASGQFYHGLLRVHAATGDAREVPSALPQLPPTIAQQLAHDWTPAVVPIRYDPEWPARAWVDGLPSDDNGLFFFSLMVLAIQGFAVLILVALAWQHARGKRGPKKLPWWLELSKVIPAGAEIAGIAMMGAAMRLAGAT